jgi:hypothetical protein
MLKSACVARATHHSHALLATSQAARRDGLAVTSRVLLAIRTRSSPSRRRLGVEDLVRRKVATGVKLASALKSPSPGVSAIGFGVGRPSGRSRALADGAVSVGAGVEVLSFPSLPLGGPCSPVIGWSVGRTGGRGRALADGAISVSGSGLFR